LCASVRNAIAYDDGIYGNFASHLLAFGSHCRALWVLGGVSGKRLKGREGQIGGC